MEDIPALEGPRVSVRCQTLVLVASGSWDHSICHRGDFKLAPSSGQSFGVEAHEANNNIVKEFYLGTRMLRNSRLVELVSWLLARCLRTSKLSTWSRIGVVAMLDVCLIV